MGECQQQKHTQHASSTKMECDYLNDWIRKWPHTQKSHPKSYTDVLVQTECMHTLPVRPNVKFYMTISKRQVLSVYLNSFSLWLDWELEPQWGYSVVTTCWSFRWHFRSGVCSPSRSGCWGGSHCSPYKAIDWTAIPIGGEGGKACLPLPSETYHSWCWVSDVCFLYHVLCTSLCICCGLCLCLRVLLWKWEKRAKKDKILGCHQLMFAVDCTVIDVFHISC